MKPKEKAELIEAVLKIGMLLMQMYFLSSVMFPNSKYSFGNVLDSLTYGVRLNHYRGKWLTLPGWKQEIWNHSTPPPKDLQVKEAPEWLT